VLVAVTSLLALLCAGLPAALLLLPACLLCFTAAALLLRRLSSLVVPLQPKIRSLPAAYCCAALLLSSYHFAFRDS